MGYAVRKLPTKAKPFKIQFIEYKGDAQKIRDVPEAEWRALGFSREMGLAAAQKRKDQLNAQLHERRHHERRNRIQARLAKEETTQDAYLNADDVADFENDVLFTRTGDSDTTSRDRIESHWRKARRIICALKIDPIDWYDQPRKFYDAFTKERMSPSYAQKVLRVINQWGKWHCRKYRRYFDPIPAPRGYEKERIADRYFDKEGAGDKESDPLTPELLEPHRVTLEPPLFNWEFISLWLGLRPHEVDSLHTRKNFRIETHQGVTVIFVYQPKLKNIPKDKRWKYIPCLLPEQEEAIRLIASGVFRRPLVKTVKARFGEGVNLYGGRKGFEFLMDSKGYRLEDYSIWLGHQTIERTWRSYKDKQRIRLPSAALLKPDQSQ